jgi:peptidoglycan-N-acetylmuramic acid deacetylase
MRNKVLIIGVALIIFTGLAGINQNSAKKPMNNKKNYLYSDITNVFNHKEGWGFVKSRDGKTPEITKHQKDLVAKYNVLFMGDQKVKRVTITFDLGYEKEGLTPKILETLKKHNIKASFFVTTHWIKKNPQIAKKLISEGHLLENHTVRHKSLPTLSDLEIREEIRGWESVALKDLNYRPKYRYMRPPMGEYSERTLKLTRDLGYRTAFWSIAIRDWLPMGGPEKAVKSITSQLHNGAVLLLHGNSEDVVNGFEQIVIQTTARGYKIVSLNEI